MLLAKLKTAGLSILAAAVLVAGAYGVGAQPPAERPKPDNTLPIIHAQVPAPGAPAESRGPTDKLVWKLNQVVNPEKEIDNTPLKDVLEFLHDKYDITFVVDVVGFARDNANRTVEDSPVRLAKMPGVPLTTVLRYLVDQVQGVAMVRAGYVEIVSVNRAYLEAYGNPLTGKVHIRQMHPLVNVAADRKLLEHVLTDIAAQSGLNVVLDARVTDREKLLVTTRLLNVPTDTAVRVLAEMSNLKSVQLDNVFFVTAREQATELQAEEAKMSERRRQIEERPVPPHNAAAPKS